MGINMLVNGYKENKMVKVNIILRMVHQKKDYGKTVKEFNGNDNLYKILYM